MNKYEVAKLIAQNIICDLQDRKGLDNAYEDIDFDTQTEIEDAWVTIAEDAISDWVY